MLVSRDHHSLEEVHRVVSDESLVQRPGHHMRRRNTWQRPHTQVYTRHQVEGQGESRRVLINIVTKSLNSSFLQKQPMRLNYRPKLVF